MILPPLPVQATGQGPRKSPRNSPRRRREPGAGRGRRPGNNIRGALRFPTWICSSSVSPHPGGSIGLGLCFFTRGSEGWVGPRGTAPGKPRNEAFQGRLNAPDRVCAPRRDPGSAFVKSGEPIELRGSRLRRHRNRDRRFDEGHNRGSLLTLCVKSLREHGNLPFGSGPLRCPGTVQESHWVWRCDCHTSRLSAGPA